MHLVDIQLLIPANVHQPLIPAVSGQSKNGFYVMDPCASPTPKNAFFIKKLNIQYVVLIYVGTFY